MVNQCSLRQYDLDQVVRVERGSLLSVPHRGTPRSVVTTIVIRLQINVNQKIGRLLRRCSSPPRNVELSYPALPLFLHLQFTGAHTRGKRKEVCEQAVEFDRLLDHREVSGTFEHNLMRES